jgi:uncharacterized protein YdeI (BOF family)
MKKFFFALALMVGLVSWPWSAQAHSPYMNCADNDDGTITCEGGFSDGSSASGVTVKVLGPDDKEIAKGAMNADDEYVFNKPAGDYKVSMDAGEGHVVTVEGKSIVK